MHRALCRGGPCKPNVLRWNQFIVEIFIDLLAYLKYFDEFWKPKATDYTLSTKYNMNHHLIMATIGLTLAANAQAQDHYNRGIGLYPGNKAEYTAPRLVGDNEYRDLALNRMATASSSIDCNLTAQLATDGLLTKGEPKTLTVSTNKGVDTSRDRLKAIDGNSVSPYYVYGPDGWTQYLWQGMTVHADTLRLCFETAYDAKLPAGWSVTVEGTTDGKTWADVGSVKRDGLPGYKTRQTVSTDPNKQTGLTNLPLRRGTVAIPLNRKGADWRGLRLRFAMPSAVWWRIYEIDDGPASDMPKEFNLGVSPWRQRNMSWLPSEHFFSAWVASPDEASQPQWLKVDLGAEADIDRLRIHWVYAAKAGLAQVSDDGANWRDVAKLSPAKDGGVASVPMKARGRYVRLWLTAPQGGTYGVAELEVLGRGGLVATPSNSLDLGKGKLSINNWQLRRDNDKATRLIKGTSPWIEATVPGTALTSYINIGAVPETTVANDMRQVSESFFNSDFTYKADILVRDGAISNGDATFDATKSHRYLCFDGIDWRATVELNGKRVGRIDGAFTRARFDISSLLKQGRNELVVHVAKNAHPGPVKTKNARSTDLNGGALAADNPTFTPTIGWDWITSTPGRCMGIWNDVYITQDDGLCLADPLVTTELAEADTLATLTPAVKVVSTREEPAKVTLNGWIGTLRFAKDITVQAGESRDVSFAPSEYRQLARRQMKLWWPNGYGTPYLYDAGFSLTSGADTLCTLRYKAGLRQVSTALEPSPDGKGKRLQIFVNGKRLDPMGGNWGFSETNLRYRGREYDATVRYHRDMNFNIIRNWVGQIGDEEFYDACDKYGIMVWQDFWLANPWDGPDPDDETMFMQNARDLISLIRRHPSVALYCGRNEGFPPATLQDALQGSIKALHPQLSYIGSSADDVVTGHGPYGIKPTEFYFKHLSHKLHSEEGMPNIPTWESLRRFLRPKDVSFGDDTWGQHDFCMKGAPRGMEFIGIMERHFGKPASPRQFTQWAQWLNYDGHRAMFESRQTDRQGLLMWMSHPCWPSMVWQTYDYYLEPTAAYFGVKKACEPLHIQWNPAEREVEVVNVCRDLDKPLMAEMRIMDAKGDTLTEKTVETRPERDTTVAAITDIAAPDEDVWFIRLRLMDGQTVVSDNFYVEGREADNPQSLAKALGEPKLSVARHFEKQGGEWTGHVEVSNTGDTPALLVRLNLVGGDGEQILPALYSDNYFALMPGEKKTVEVRFSDADSRGTRPDIVCQPFTLGE